MVLVTGRPVPAVESRRGGFADLIRVAARNAWPGGWLDVDLPAGDTPPPRDAVSAVIVTGSAASVLDQEPWSLRGQRYLADAVSRELPVLGICYGHQMLAAALGGRVAKNPRGREIGTVDFEVVVGDPLFDPHIQPTRANMTHVDVVSDLPPGAVLLARTALDPNAAVRFAPSAWGVQFHPEMDRDVIFGYVESKKEQMAQEGLDVGAVLAALDDAPAGAAVLRRFLRKVRGALD
jgi:GMP synthase (glutamine-hydrolysing)